jgi:IS30 family transposase
MAARKLTDKQREQIAPLRASGLTTQEIASRFGCSSGAIDWYCLINAIEPPPGRRGPLRLVPNELISYTRSDGRKARFFTIDEDARLLELEKKGLNYSQIGRALGRKHNVVHARLAVLARRAERAEELRDQAGPAQACSQSKNRCT